MRLLKPSVYNFIVSPADDKASVLYNASTGGVLGLGGPTAAALSKALLDPTLRLEETQFPEPLLDSLLHVGALVSKDSDELAVIRDRFWRARTNTPMVITVTTTMGCNLACYYCYQDRSGSELKNGDIDTLRNYVRDKLAAHDRTYLHIDWYGGEPMLNVDFIEAASKALIADCDRNGISYVASIISNGTNWPEDIEDFIARTRIRQVQISFDGMRAHHEKRRRYRDAENHIGDSSFEKAVAVVDRLVKCVRTDIRYNIDRRNAEDILPFIDFASERGWFAAAFPAVFQPARLSAYSERSSFMRNWELSVEEFDALRADVRAAMDGVGRVEEGEVPDGFPHPKTSVCAALSTASAVIGADSKVYRCGLQVGEVGRAVDHIGAPDSGVAKVEGSDENDGTWWDEFDPTLRPTCSKCSFLPICWGGCPKTHLEKDQHATDEQGIWWRANLPRLIGDAAGFSELTEDTVPLELQFRQQA